MNETPTPGAAATGGFLLVPTLQEIAGKLVRRSETPLQLADARMRSWWPSITGGEIKHNTAMKARTVTHACYRRQLT